MVEPEMAFAGLEEDMELAEALIKYLVKQVWEQAPEEMEFFQRFIEKDLFTRLENLLEAEFARITYTEAVKLLQESGVAFEYPVEWGRTSRRNMSGI